MRNPHQVTRDFEAALSEYTGAPYVVTTNSCTAAIMLAVAWHLRNGASIKEFEAAPVLRLPNGEHHGLPAIEIPKRTYVSVPMAIIHAGGRPVFRDADWVGLYQLAPLPVWDSARHFTSGMYIGNIGQQNEVVEQGRLPSGKKYEIQVNEKRDFSGHMVCVSFQAAKHLGIEQGGAILHDNAEADAWLRRARFDGRTEGVAPKYDTFTMIGHHCYLNPSTAAQGILRLHSLPRHNEPLPNDEYPDLSTMHIFK